jgi:hypothetical protein
MMPVAARHQPNNDALVDARQPVPGRVGGSDFIAKLRRWVRDDSHPPNVESVADLVDDFAAFLDEVDVSPSSSSTMGAL